MQYFFWHFIKELLWFLSHAILFSLSQEELTLLMNGIETNQLLFEWKHPLPDPELFVGFNSNEFNVMFIGQSGDGKSSFLDFVNMPQL